MTDIVNDYGPVAWLYDTYVRVVFDLPFFRQEAARATGPVLELAAGTGRISEVLVAAKVVVTCVDVSRDMLRVLKRKLGGVAKPPLVVCADMRRLPFQDYYHLVVIPFNSFLEITDERDRMQTLSEVRRVLMPGGRLVCTLHNPTVRRRSFGSDPRLLGQFEVPGSGGNLEVWVSETWKPETEVAEAVQTYRLYDAHGSLEREQVMRVRFSLIEQPAFVSMARESGFEVVELLGDYDRSEFNAESSPYMIWILQRS